MTKSRVRIGGWSYPLYSVNTLVIGVVGGALAVACYAAIGLTSHRWQSGWAKVLDYLVMLPRGMPGHSCTP